LEDRVLLIATATILTAMAPDPVAAASPAIDRANAEWLPAMRNADASVIAAPYADNGLLVLPDGTSVKGREAIRRLYAEGLRARKVVGGGIRSTGRAAAGPGLVIEWGEGTVTRASADGTTASSGGPYLTVWAQQSDGQWRIIRNLVF
jgi:uncharacterized protein (TIGR02246 family)